MEAPPVIVQPRSRGEALLERTAAQLDALDAALREQDLPKVMRRDLASTSGRLRAQAEALARQVQRLEVALSATDEFEARIGRDHGFDHPDVKRIIATRSKWRRTLITLKKTTGI